MEIKDILKKLREEKKLTEQSSPQPIKAVGSYLLPNKKARKL